MQGDSGLRSSVNPRATQLHDHLVYRVCSVYRERKEKVGNPARGSRRGQPGQLVAGGSSSLKRQYRSTIIMADTRCTNRRNRTGTASCGSWRRGAASVVGVLAFAGWGQRVAEADPCVVSTGKTGIEIGKPTSVCLVVNKLVWEVEETAKYSQVLILPDADEFSRFSVTGSWNSSDTDLDPILTTYGPDVGIHVESMGQYSFQKSFRRRANETTFPLYTAIIAVDNGEVTGITWDDGCHFCGSDQCEDNTFGYNGVLVEGPASGKDCYWPDSECVEDGVTGSVSSLCQLTVYVVWTGTDSKGNYFTSFSKRLSMYAGEAVDSLIDDASSAFQATIAANEPNVEE